MEINVDQFIKDCKSKGLNVTYQRLAIYKTLMKDPVHPTAENIYNKVKAEYPTISLATVYKNLDTLAEHNLIAKVTHLHDLARFDGDTNPHHHLVCIKCKKIIDIPGSEFNNLTIPEEMRNEFRILNYRVQFDGICSECLKEEH